MDNQNDSVIAQGNNGGTSDIGSMIGSTPNVAPQQPQATEPQAPQSPTVENPPADSFDISAYEKEPGITDWEKVQNLVHEKDRIEKSARYYQSQFMKKNDVPEKVEDYRKDFRPDSKYEKFVDNENFKKIENQIYEFAHKNGIGRNSAQAFVNFVTMQAVDNGMIDTRSDEQKQLDEDNFQKELTQELSPYLNSIGRSREENDLLLKGFIEGNNPFATNDNTRDMLRAITRTPEGYTFVSEVMEFFDNRGIPGNNNVMPITGSVENGDRTALLQKLATATGDEADRLLADFYGKKTINPQ